MTTPQAKYSKIDYSDKKVTDESGHRVPNCKVCRKQLTYPYFISGEGFYYHLDCVGERSRE